MSNSRGTADGKNGSTFRNQKDESTKNDRNHHSTPKFNFKATVGSTSNQVEDIDLSNFATFKHLSTEQMKSKGILVQAKTYKKSKTLPLVGGDSVRTLNGQTVKFYKQGPKIYMEISGIVYHPKVAVEHLSGIFKDYNIQDLHLDEFQRFNVPDLSCPLCNQAFEHERELVEHCEDCNNGPGVEQLLSDEQCPICLKTFSSRLIKDHAEECAQSNFG